jgi:hypothetical protein
VRLLAEVEAMSMQEFLTEDAARRSAVASPAA